MWWWVCCWWWWFGGDEVDGLVSLEVEILRSRSEMTAEILGRV